jgi:hypothetical protein
MNLSNWFQCEIENRHRDITSCILGYVPTFLRKILPHLYSECGDWTLLKRNMNMNFVTPELLTAVVMKSSVLWDITPCGSLKVNRCFGGICCLNRYGRRISQTRNKCEASSKQDRLFNMNSHCSDNHISCRPVGITSSYYLFYLFI